MTLRNCDLIAFVATAQPDRARHFYRDILGLNLVEETPVALVFDAHGTMLRIAKTQKLAAVPYTVLGWKAADLRSTMAELSQRGVVFERYQGLAQDETGVWTSPGGELVSWFKDPDGNTLSLSQFGS
jgi:catechol 2,3-dioxygenase-like lactoylglutathione lyase family enzyme